MDRFEDLRAFVAVVETGSFTAAAERLALAKSAVSRRVAGLEERLAAELIRRTTRRLSLTEAGQNFYKRSASILADLEEAESAVAHAHGELSGQLRLALPLSFGVHHLSEPIAAFSRQHPRLEFDLDLDDRRVDLLREGIDLAVRIGDLQDSTLVARKLFEARTVVVASPGYLQAHGMPEHIDELANHRCIAYGNLADPSKWGCIDGDGKRHVFNVPAYMTATSGDFICSMAVQGMGLAMQPTFIAGEFVRRGELVPVLTDYQWPVTPAHAVYPLTRHLSYRVRAFIDYLVTYFAGTPPWDRVREHPPPD